MRSEIVGKKNDEIQNEELIKVLTERLREKLIEKENTEVSILLREEFIKNLTEAQNNKDPCDLDDIEKYNQMLVGFQDKENELRSSMNSTDT